ncbi:sensor histidine kinase [Devosia nitrariae]|uniref:histidine kinase n=1 Tax=Devosia nitrariae TaxID=2071872 RepID=A0ABQ5W4Q0_9HYPH|nr:sensor histidine kinase [Devosia nitrariae]GLQ54828.1 sodium:solute symporter [Devosia nitrariae]
MLSADLVIATAIAYVGLLFLIAYVGDRRTRNRPGGLLRSPLVYTLSISVYCTSWTFYGAVGSAARNGLEYLAIYLGPTLVFIGWWFILRRLVRISHEQRITSVADLLSSRFGKSSRLAVLVTVIAVIAIAPYIALQLKAVTSSIQAIAGTSEMARGRLTGIDEVGLAFGIAAGMALFTILFGTRNVDAKEQHHGVVAAIAFEAVVKLTALIAVGVFVIYAGGGFEGIFSTAEAAGVEIYSSDTFGTRWVAMNLLSFAAIICLPRQFQITVVENSDENHLRTASWAFPLYMLAMSLFILPIALYGLTSMPEGANPDMFVLTLPLFAGHESLALFAFIGGFSSATSMIIVESIALSIMVSNHIVMPVVLRLASDARASDGRGVSRLLLNSRRFSIVLILALGFAYFYLTRDSDALAPIGLISFAGVAQFLPAILAALFWREASIKAATAAVAVGFVVWAWSSFLPSFESTSTTVAAIMAKGPWGITWLRPEALFGLEGLDPLVHAVFWSLFLNTATLAVVSLLTSRSALERLQTNLFVNVFGRTSGSGQTFMRGSAAVNDLFFVAQRVLGDERAVALFGNEASESGQVWTDLEPTPAFIGRLERELAGSIGAASAHVMLSKVVSGDAISLEEVMQMADETQQAIEYSQQLEKTSAELRSTADQLEIANRQLRDLDQAKDEFLSQVSHEVRTPMTAIRAFSEILLEAEDLKGAEREKFISTIHKESLRLTTLLDEILDLSALERGERGWENQPVDAESVLEQAVHVCHALARQRAMTIRLARRAKAATVSADPDRLGQVLINLISNAIKYNSTEHPQVTVSSRIVDGAYCVEVADNGPGIAKAERGKIFEKFYRGRRAGAALTGAGLGLAISRQIVARMNGKLELIEGTRRGACFRVTLPLLKAEAMAGE